MPRCEDALPGNLPPLLFRATGEPAPDELLAYTSPVGWGHIAFSGDFLWDRAAEMPPGRWALNVGSAKLAA